MKSKCFQTFLMLSNNKNKTIYGVNNVIYDIL